MKVLVLAGAGSMGSVTVRDLIRSPDVSEVVIGDIDLKKARNYADNIGSEKLSAEHVDIMDHASLVKLMKRVDVVADATFWSLRDRVDNAAIEAQVDVADLGGGYYLTLKQLALNELAKEAGITIVAGIGVGPGLSNVLSKFGADKLDRVEEIYIRYGVSALSPIRRPGLNFVWRLYDNFMLLNTKPLIFRDGKLIELEPRAGKEIFKFPQPLGDMEVNYSIHSEFATIPRTIKGLKNMDVKIGFPSEIESALEALIDLGLDSTQLLEVEGIMIEPRKLISSCLVTLSKATEMWKDAFALVVEVIGEKEGEKVQYILETVTEPMGKWGVSATGYITGIPLSIATQMLGRGDITLKGVHAPEECIDPQAFVKELSTRDIEVYEKVKRKIIP